MRYVVTATADGGISNPANWVESGPSGNTKRTVVELDPVYRKALTAGQTFYWGVDVVKKTGAEWESQSIFGSSDFESAPVAASTPYASVTVLTHGFQLGLLASFFENGQFQQPPAFMDMAQLIVAASGGGVVLSYDKLTGRWEDRATGLIGAAALAKAAGKAVVLVSDWYVESDISEVGFAEAAADAIYASIVELDRQTGGQFVAPAGGHGQATYTQGALLKSPLHFVGHSRGTVVNSEIIQRLGYNKVVESGIHMTTLDPHDFQQKSLDMPVGDALSKIKSVADKIQTGAIVAGVAAAFSGNWAAIPALYRAYTYADKVSKGIEKALNMASSLGVSLNIRYGDFKDPNVQVWSNVAFADNYYQTAAAPDGVTATPNGRPLDPTPDPDPSNPEASPTFSRAQSTADIDLLLGHTMPADGGGRFRFRGLRRRPASAGRTAACGSGMPAPSTPAALEFQDMPIWRSAGDEGLATEIFSVVPLTTTYNNRPVVFEQPVQDHRRAGRQLPADTRQRASPTSTKASPTAGTSAQPAAAWPTGPTAAAPPSMSPSTTPNTPTAARCRRTVRCPGSSTATSSMG